MNTKWRGLIFAACIVLAIPATAQETAAKEAPAKKTVAPAEAVRAIPKPGPEIEKLKWLIGTWTYTDKYEDSAIRKAGVGRGTVTVKPGPGGHSLISDFKTVSDRGEEIGYGFFIWDAKGKAYKTFEVGNEFPGIVTGSGKWEGDKLVFTWEVGEGAQKMILRGVYSDIQPNSTTITLHVGPPGGPMKLAVTSTCVKK